MNSRLESPGAIALLAGIGCYFSAFAVLVLLPSLLTNQDDPWVVGPDGVDRHVRPYSDAEQRGRTVYGRQVCFHCHSQFIRPVNDEDKRWGPVSQTGEYAHDLPHLFGTRRIGPDLHREGGLRTDDWHFAHFFDPRATVPRSVMPGFTWLFDDNPRAGAVREALDLLDTNGDGVLSTKIGDDGGAAPPSIADKVRAARDSVARTDAGGRPDWRGLKGVGGTNDSMWWNEGAESGEGLVTDYDGGPIPNADCLDLTLYVQRLGTSIGMWRNPLAAATSPRRSPFDDAQAPPKRTAAMRVHGFHRFDDAYVKAAEKANEEWRKATETWESKYPLLKSRLAKGREIYDRHCAGCHGAEGRGNGTGAPFMPTRPRDFTVAKFKFRSTPVGTLPLDGDLFRSISRGLPGTAMPSWAELSDEQIWLLVDFVKSLSESESGFNDRSRAVPSSPERFHANPAREILRGRAVFLTSATQCGLCHGTEARGDGTNWNNQANDYGGAQRPRDLRPRIRLEDAPELYVLMGKKLERLFGAEAWDPLSKTAAWVDLEPKDEAKRRAFVLFLLGEGPRAVDVLGGADPVKAALGDRAGELFTRLGDDPIEDVRMSVATEKDRPALRVRGGAHAQDLYRTVMTGIEGTAMKAGFDTFWEPSEVKGGLDWDKKPARTDRKPVYLPKSGNEVKLSVVPTDPRLAEAGVVVKEVDGKPQASITMQPGDDWALIHYVRWLMCEPRDRAGN